MKTKLLSIMMALIISVGYGQSKFIDKIQTGNHFQLKQTSMHPNQGTSNQEAVIGQKLIDYTVIGTTWNDLQTLNYGNVMQRMWVYPDGTVGSTWLSAGQENEPERGAGYNYFDGTEWGEPNLHVGPINRMGSPCYAPWGPEGEIIALYRYIENQGPIFFYKREVKGEGDWVEVELTPPAGISLVWHSMITSGENHEHIHLLAETYDAPYEGQENALLYYRSSDGAESWDISEEIIEGLGSDYLADINDLSYDWANPVGDTIAFSYGFDEFGGRVFKSYDNGDTWEFITALISPFSSLDPPLTSDRFGSGVGSSACVLDSEGKAHVAFSRMFKNFQEDGVYYEPYTDGMLYWNESMPPLDSTIISTYTTEFLEDGGYLIGWVLGDETYEVPESQPTYANALCAYPQLSIDADDNLFIAYSSVAPGYNNTIYTFRHIITNSSFDGGITWQGQIDLHTELEFVFSECAFPMMPPVIQDFIHVTYQEDFEPGINEWLEDHPPVENRIHHMKLEKSFFTGISENTTAMGLSMSEGYPNPVTDKLSFRLNFQTKTEISYCITNITGQILKEGSPGIMNKGTSTISIDVSDLQDGIYFCTMFDGKQQTSRKFIVK